MPLTLTAEQKSIYKIFSTNDQYLIPSYQRPYSWGLTHCSELWDDIKSFFDGPNNKEGYFLGNIVIAKGRDEEYFEVIDGQQRLITITLLLKALSLYDSENRALSDSIWIEIRRSLEKRPRVQSAVFADKDNTYLRECLDLKEKPNNSNSASRFMNNLSFFCEKIDELGVNVTRFADFVLDDIFLLPIQSDDQSQDKARDKALTIFETINNRGLDLADADIFKAQLYIAAVNQSRHEQFMSRWNCLAEDAENMEQKIDDIFRVYMHILRGKNKDREREIGLRQFFTQDSEKYKSLKKMDDLYVMTDLEKVVLCIQYYISFIEGERTSDIIDKELTKWFQIIDVYSNAYPKYAIYVFIFNHGYIDENNNLGLSIESKKLLNTFAQNIIRYVYNAGATSLIKFEIHEVIVQVSQNENYEYYPENIHLLDFRYPGRLKKGFALLATYLNKEQNPITPYYLDTLFKRSYSLNNDFMIKDEIANFIIVDQKNYNTRNKPLNERIKFFEESQIDDLKSMTTDLVLWDDEKYIKRSQMLKHRLLTFFQK